MMRKLLFLFILFCAACSDETIVDQEYFFDIPKYFQDLEAEGFSTKRNVQKVLTGPTEEVKEIVDYDLSENLSFLKRYNINRAAWADKYVVEAGADSDCYSTSEKDLIVKKLCTFKRDGKVFAFELFCSQTNFLKSTTEQRINFDEDKGYTITTSTDENMPVTLVVKFK